MLDGELGDVHVVQAAHIDGAEVAAELLHEAPAEDLDAAVLAEVAVVAAGADPVLAQFALALEDAEAGGGTCVVVPPIFVQTVQLQRFTASLRSTSASNRTAPQWQPPTYFLREEEVFGARSLIWVSPG